MIQIKTNESCPQIDTDLLASWKKNPFTFLHVDLFCLLLIVLSLWANNWIYMYMCLVMFLFLDIWLPFITCCAFNMMIETFIDMF